MKIGIFGGTFNPLHNSHIKVIRYLKEELKIIDKIIVVPNGDPVHKTENLTNKFERYIMVVESIQELGMFTQNYQVSSFEVTSSEPSESIELLKHMFMTYPDDELFFILGSDSFFTIHEWGLYDKFLSMVNLIVMERGNSIELFKFDKYIKKVFDPRYTSFALESERELFCFVTQDKTKKSIYICEVPYTNLSSSMIRQRIRDGKNITNLVPNAVNNHLF